MESDFPEDLGEVRREVQDATRALIQNLGFAHPFARPRKSAPHGFVPVTSQQWRVILVQARLYEQWLALRATVLELVSMTAVSGGALGKSLPPLVRSLTAVTTGIADVAHEVARFAPPAALRNEQRVAEALTDAALVVTQATSACLRRGWDPSLWPAVREAVADADAAGERLLLLKALPAETVEGQDAEDVYARALGLSVADVGQAEGVAAIARLAVCWAEDPRALDRRLRRQSRHLIGSTLPITGKLRLHLAALAVAGGPLVAHRAATLARDLVSESLRRDLELTQSVIARHVQGEPLMLAAHQGERAAWTVYQRPGSGDNKAAALGSLYKTVAESDVKRTAIAVLELLSRTVPAGISLARVKDQLLAEDRPLCSMLAAVIEPEWRNAIAHESFHWDAPHSKVRMGNRLVGLEELRDTAFTARTMCEGFEHGVAVAFAQHARMNPWGMGAPGDITRRLDGLRGMGAAGQKVLDADRRGDTLHLLVPNVSPGTLRTLFRALLRAARSDETIARWIVDQEESGRPALYLDREAMEAALRLADGYEATVDPLPFAELPLVANAMVLADKTPEVTVSTVLCLAAAHVIGERERLRDALLRGERSAKSELLSTARGVCSGLEVAVQVLGEDTSGRRLLAFAKVLAGDCHWYEGSPPNALAGGLRPADRVLLRHAPMHLPWTVADTRGRAQ